VDYLVKPKIVFPDIATECRFTLDRDGRFVANTVYFCHDDLRLLGCSTPDWRYSISSKPALALEGTGKAYLRFFGQYLEAFPCACRLRRRTNVTLE